jgi:hypothetical protein
MGKALTIKVPLNLPKFPEQFDQKSILYMEAVGIVFRASVFRYLGTVIKYSRVDTGRMKSAWTPIFEAFGFDYTKYWTYGPNETPQAAGEGKEQGSYQYNPEADPFTLIVTNSVKYSQYVEEKVGSTVRGPLPSLVPLFETYFREGYEYLNKSLKDDFDKGTYPSQNQFPSEAY